MAGVELDLHGACDGHAGSNEKQGASQGDHVRREPDLLGTTIRPKPVTSRWGEGCGARRQVASIGGRCTRRGVVVTDPCHRKSAPGSVLRRRPSDRKDAKRCRRRAIRLKLGPIEQDGAP
jgi:hypothetical protein